MKPGPVRTAAAARMLNASAAPDFLEAAHEWRRIFSEAWGTFQLVLVASGAGVQRAGNFPWSRVPGYVIAQSAGGILASCFLPRHVRQYSAPRRHSTRSRGERSPGAGHGSASNNRPGQHHPGHCLGRPQHWFERRSGRRRLHRPGLTLGRSDQWCFDEPRRGHWPPTWYAATCTPPGSMRLAR